MKRSLLPVVSLILVGALLLGWSHAASANAPRAQQATQAVAPIEVTDAVGDSGTTPIPPTFSPGQAGAGKFAPPVTLNDLLKQYPDLKPYLDKVQGMKVGEMDFG